MSERHLFTLSPYRLPTHHQITLNEEEMASWLNAMVCVWHPALIWSAKGPPRVDSSYDHEMPAAGEVFAIPSSPALFQPDDWPFRVQHAGAIRFEATADRRETMQNIDRALREAMAGGNDQARAAFGMPEIRALLDLSPEQVRPFLGLGFGYLIIESLFDAMDHEHLLAIDEFWSHVQQAIQALLEPGAETQASESLRQAARQLGLAREVLYPTSVHLLDIAIIDEKSLDKPLPATFDRGLALNVLLTGHHLELLAASRPELVSLLKQKLNPDLQPPMLEIGGGIYTDREDSLLPIESQLWNLEKGKKVVRQLLDYEVQVFGRRRSAFHPQTPLFLTALGLRQALLLNLDNAVLPSHRATVVNWASPDGRSIDAFTRAPQKASQASTFFNLVYSLHQSISQDAAPTLALLHEGDAPFPLYDDWLSLTELGAALGQWTTFSRYFSDALAGEYVGAASPDDFFADYLDERVTQHRADPVSAFARQARQRRRIDAAWSLAAVQRTLLPRTSEDDIVCEKLKAAEDILETAGLDDKAAGVAVAHEQVVRIEQQIADKLANRLQARAQENQPGYLLLNPCAFARRAALELDPIEGGFAIEGAVKAAQFDSDKLRMVVELPPLGFAWVPRTGASGPASPKTKMRLADDATVRNEFFEAEIDQATGGLRAIRDLRTRAARVAQQLVYNPGSKMQAHSIRITSNGPALGEITSGGLILDEQNQPLANFRQRYRAWIGRPLLDLRIEIEPLHAPTGYPWHSYYGARFAWRDDSAALMRGVNGVSNQTNHTRPVSPDFLEIRVGRQNTLIFTGGLPFNQRHGSRMVDLVLVPEGERAQVFDIGLAIDRENLMQTALGFISPVAVVTTEKGPPHIGPSGWLFHVDAPNLVMTSLRPTLGDGQSRRLRVDFLETSGYGGSGELRCARNPVAAYVLDGEGTPSTELPISGDAVRIDFSANDLQRLRIDFD